MKTVIAVILFFCVGSAFAREVQVIRDRTTDRPTFLLVKGISRAHGVSALSKDRAIKLAEDFLASEGSALGIKDVASELKLERVETDQLGFSHVRYHQIYQGVPVVAGEIYVHLNKRGEVYEVNGKFASNLSIGTSPSIAKEQAEALARNQSIADYQLPGAPETPRTTLVILPLGIVDNKSAPPTPPVNGGEGGSDDARLCWEVLVNSAEDHPRSVTYYIDALNASVSKVLENDRQLYRKVYDCAVIPGWVGCYLDSYGGRFNGVDYYFGRSENEPPRGPYPRSEYPFYYGSTDVDSCWQMLGVCHNYWLTTFGRDGANGQGGLGAGTSIPLTETWGYVHADNYSANCPHNSWFGPVGGVALCRGMVVPDAVGHEYTHGVTFFNFTDGGGNPVGTTYQGQTGALEESNSDVFGEATELFYTGTHDWMSAGASIGGAFRNLANPPSLSDHVMGPFPDRFQSSSVWCGAYDFGGVHQNATIPDKAAYLMSDGGQFNGCYIPGIGFAAVQQLFYRGWTTYFTRTVTFNEAVTALQQACLDLYPDSLASVTAALQAVEMDQPGRCDTTSVEQAPACAVHSAGIVSADSLSYGAVVASGCAGVPGRVVTMYLRAHQDSTGIWSAISDTIHIAGIIGADSSLHLQLLAPDTGRFDIVADENNDGFYQPWADTILTVQVRAGAVQHLVAQYVEPERIRLTWLSLSGAGQYAVECDSTMSFASPFTLATIADTTFVDSVSVAAHSRMFYRVRAVAE